MRRHPNFWHFICVWGKLPIICGAFLRCRTLRHSNYHRERWPWLVTFTQELGLHDILHGFLPGKNGFRVDTEKKDLWCDIRWVNHFQRHSVPGGPPYMFWTVLIDMLSVTGGKVAEVMICPPEMDLVQYVCHHAIYVDVISNPELKNRDQSKTSSETRPAIETAFRISTSFHYTYWTSPELLKLLHYCCSGLMCGCFRRRP